MAAMTRQEGKDLLERIFDRLFLPDPGMPRLSEEERWTACQTIADLLHTFAKTVRSNTEAGHEPEALDG